MRSNMFLFYLVLKIISYYNVLIDKVGEDETFLTM